MYRLTINQTSKTMPYIVVDCQTLEECTKCLEDYKKRKSSCFINYDLIKYDEILEDSNTLEDVTFPELRKEGYV
jgi:hypothetical protein